jgi:hypothetical protein
VPRTINADHPLRRQRQADNGQIGDGNDPCRQQQVGGEQVRGLQRDDGHGGVAGRDADSNIMVPARRASQNGSLAAAAHRHTRATAVTHPRHNRDAAR